LCLSLDYRYSTCSVLKKHSHLFIEDVVQSAQQSDSHPPSEKEANTDEAKAKTSVAAVLDPSFPLPTLEAEKTPATRYIRSFVVLIVLLSAAVFGAWFLELSILQIGSTASTSSNPKSKDVLLTLGMAMPVQQLALLLGVTSVLFLAMWFTGTVWIDWWQLVIGYWRLSIPIGAPAGFAVYSGAGED
jgi:hypothetical protein